MASTSGIDPTLSPHDGRTVERETEGPHDAQAMHVIVWEFSVPSEHRQAFEQAYGPEGAWAALFRTARGYLGTELLRDEQMIGRSLTIDRWSTPEDFAAFKRASGAAYGSLDRQFESLTAREVTVGTFQAVASKGATR